jgi:hypothetical protein
MLWDATSCGKAAPLSLSPCLSYSSSGVRLMSKFHSQPGRSERLMVCPTSRMNRCRCIRCACTRNSMHAAAAATATAAAPTAYAHRYCQCGESLGGSGGGAGGTVSRKSEATSQTERSDRHFYPTQPAN